MTDVACGFLSSDIQSIPSFREDVKKHMVNAITDLLDTGDGSQAKETALKAISYYTGNESAGSGTLTGRYIDVSVSIRLQEDELTKSQMYSLIEFVRSGIKQRSVCLQLFSDLAFVLGAHRTVRGHATLSTAPVYAYLFSFDGDLGLAKLAFHTGMDGKETNTADMSTALGCCAVQHGSSD